MKYLTRWRMHKATRLLKNEVQMDKIAQQLGYDLDRLLHQVQIEEAFPLNS